MPYLLKYVSKKFVIRMAREDHDYRNISKVCNIHTAESIHKANDILFINNALMGKIGGESLTRMFPIRNQHYHLRHSRLIREKPSMFNYIHHSPIHRVPRIWNSLPEEYNTTDPEENYQQLNRKTFLEYF